jgi:hypothetical protein
MDLETKFKKLTGFDAYADNDLRPKVPSDYYVEWLEEQLTISSVVNCVYVVTERDNYGDQTFKGVFANKEQAIEFLAKDGLKESNIDEINKIELD